MFKKLRAFVSAFIAATVLSAPLLRNLFQESNPLRAARRSSGLSVTAFARMLGLSRQRLHVLERATGGEALLRACARAQAHSA